LKLISRRCPRYNHAFAGEIGAKPKEKHVKAKTRYDEMADSEVLAMALDDMEFLRLIKWKPDASKKPTTDENPKAHDEASSGLVLAEGDSRASFAERLDDQVRQLLEQAQGRN
jgi:hypothetical protein